MFFKQFYLQGLGYASYLMGSEEIGEALLFDPQLHVDGYFADATSRWVTTVARFS